MSDFTYHNIFETKGIEYIITIVFFLMLIPFWRLLNRKEKVVQTVNQMQGLLKPALLSAPKGLFYSRNHTWAFLERTGMARIGLDDLLVQLTGRVKVKWMRQEGDDIKKGEIFALIEKEDKMLRIVSPVSGKVVKTNGLLLESPGLLFDDPYGAGWLYELEPSNWRAETQNAFMAGHALNWLNTELIRFKDFIIQTTNASALEDRQIVFQDGGELMNQTLTDFPREVWESFENEFLNLG
ncbi:MAG: glycine cleavage system protein H [Prolixibacteraceae bacterium]